MAFEGLSDGMIDSSGQRSTELSQLRYSPSLFPPLLPVLSVSKNLILLAATQDGCT